MIIYNETFIIDDGVNKEWLNWMQTVHIPAVMATGLFNSYRILNVMDSPNEGATYCIQYHADTIENYYQFKDKHRQYLQDAHSKQFENKFVLFDTLMQTID